MNDTYSFGSSGRAVAFPVMGYALYSSPHKGEENNAATRWTGPALSGRFPGVVKSGLEVSEWGWLSGKTKCENSRNVERGRPFRSVPERIYYSQQIPVQISLQQRGFRTSRILREDVNKSPISTRFLRDLWEGWNTFVLFVIWESTVQLCTIRRGTIVFKERESYVQQRWEESRTVRREPGLLKSWAFWFNKIFTQCQFAVCLRFWTHWCK